MGVLSFSEAAKKLPKDGHGFCLLALDAVDEFFQQPIHEAMAYSQEHQGHLETMRRELQIVEDAHAKAEAYHGQALQDHQTARVAQSDAEKQMAITDKEVRMILSVIKDHEFQLEAKMRELISFMKFLLEAYR